MKSITYPDRHHSAQFLYWPAYAVALTFFALCCLAFASNPAFAINDDVYAEITRIESEAGAYSPKLSEHLVTLASQYQAKGKHDDAVEVYKRAIHVQRINEGLYNLNQVPVIERMIDSQIALGNWEEAANRHDHLFWLHQRNYGENDPQMLPILSKTSKWHLNAYSVSPVNTAEHLVRAFQLFSQSIRIVEQNYGNTDLRLIEPLQGLAISNYYLARWRASQEERRPNKASINESSIKITNQKLSEAERRTRINQYMLNSYHSGKKSIAHIKTIFEANEDTDPVNVIKAQIQLGDWYMLFNRTNSAHEEYQAAYHALEQHQDLAEFRQQMFGKPRALPDLPTIEADAGDTNKPQDYVIVKFDVNPRGNAQNIDILESKPSNRVSNRVLVRRNLKVAKFRPQYDKGEPVPAEGIVHRYIIPR